MFKKINIEGLELQIPIISPNDPNLKRKEQSEILKCIRKQANMSRTDICESLEIPYRTLQEWELGKRLMPKYLLKLIVYKIKNERRL